MTFIILDLDNTIFDDAWRIPRINWKEQDPFKRYHEYHSLAPFDEIGNVDLFENTPHEIIIMTARPVHYRAQTEEKLLRHGIDPALILMRNTSDHVHSKELKRQQLCSLKPAHGILREDIVCAYDDRQDVVDMYRRTLGIKAEVRRIHNVPYGDESK